MSTMNFYFIAQNVQFLEENCKPPQNKEQIYLDSEIIMQVQQNI